MVKDYTSCLLYAALRDGEVVVGEGGPVVVAPRARACRKIMIIDVSKAHLYALIYFDVHVYVELPPECRKEGVCGRLNYWLYGMRRASK